MQKKIYLVIAISIFTLTLLGGAVQLVKADAICTFQSDIAACSGSETNSSTGLTADQCHTFCTNEFTFGGGSGCWVLSGDNTCRCKINGTASAGGTRPGGNCSVSSAPPPQPSPTPSPSPTPTPQPTPIPSPVPTPSPNPSPNPSPSPSPTPTAPSSTPVTGGVENPIGAKTLDALIGSITLWLYIFSVPILALMILYGAFLMVTSAGNEEKYSQGLKVLKWGVLGFILVILSSAIAAIIRAVVS